MNMKLRYRLFLRRKSVYYAFDDTTKTFTSLKTKDKAEANRLLMAMNEAGKQPAMNLSLARVYLRHSDPLVTTRTWQNVLDEIIAIKAGPTQARWKSAAKDKAFDLIRDRVLIETQAEHLLAVLRTGTVSTNAFLRKIHNFAVDMNWLPATVIPRRQRQIRRREPSLLAGLHQPPEHFQFTGFHLDRPHLQAIPPYPYPPLRGGYGQGGNCLAR
jgi:hypothetical protein